MADAPSAGSPTPAPELGAVPAATPLDPDGPPARSAPARRDRLGLVVPAILAAIGLAAALIAWRTSVAAGEADAATEAGINAARQRAASVIVGEGFTARSTEAYVDYERARRRAELLAGDDQAEAAQLALMEATSHWFLVRPEYLDVEGAYEPDRQRAALLAADASRNDLEPDRHFALADKEYGRIRQLLVAGILIAIALPLLTLAEIGRRRLRGGAVIGGTAVFAIGAVFAVMAWV